MVKSDFLGDVERISDKRVADLYVPVPDMAVIMPVLLLSSVTYISAPHVRKGRSNDAQSKALAS
jgi:hypothetical protein